MQQMPSKDEPEKAETGQRENGRLEFAPDSISPAYPGLDGVIENYQCADCSEHADYLNKPHPISASITEHFKMP